MKRWLSLLLCAVLAMTGLTIGGTAAAGFSIGAVESLTLSGDSAYVNTVKTEKADAISALQELLRSATRSTAKPSAASEIARIKVSESGSSSARTFTLSRSEKRYILSEGSTHRQIAYADFNKLVNTIGSDKVYKYRAMPKASFSAHGLKVSGAFTAVSYNYRRLSGQSLAVDEVIDSPNPPTPIRTDGSLYLPTFSPGPDSVRVTVSGDTNWQGSGAQAESYKLPKKGAYTVQIKLGYDNSYAQNSFTYVYRIDNTDGIKFAVEGGNTHLGEPVILRVTGTTASDPLATFTSDISLNLPPTFHRQPDGSQLAIFPVSYRNTAGDHWIKITCGSESARFSISAADKKWQIQNLTVSSSTTEQTINSQKANAEYEQVIAPLRSVEDNTQHWSGRFILPVSDQKVTTEFGMVRYVNGSPTSERHGALDLAVPLGTPVKATGGGRVLYAGYLQLTGNTVLIEHGFGLKSWYYHMDSLSVKTGATVDQGHIIGKVGSTGFSTGPHLHFGMSVNNVFINPYTAINTDLFNF